MKMDRSPSSQNSVNLEGASTSRIALFASAVGIVVLVLYASQPLVGVIGPELDISNNMSGLATTVTLLGYAAGLFFLVPLSDVVENKRLILTTLGADALALSVLAISPNGLVFLSASFVVGLLTSAIQMLVPVAASLSSEAHRGRTIGNVMSGLMLGILLSRPIASLVTQFFGWRYFYGALGMSVAILTIILYRRIPSFRPTGRATYGQLVRSLMSLVKEEPVLRYRAASQAMCMGAFGLFWTSVALQLGQAPFSLGQQGIALFALAGAAGVVIAPIAGRAGDRGLTGPMTVMAHLAIICAFFLAFAGVVLLPDKRSISLGLVVLAAVVLDLGVIADQTLGRRAINLLRPEARGRMNGLFTGLFFLGGAVGSALSGIVWNTWGWSGICIAGLIFATFAAAVFLTKSSV
ncbi:putative MFS family arabinose efflux permease [Herbaspirillum seropedicae]|uniref:MFS transporter n=1 Tax=Herbaspirillum seropedicae TaxID=964 RepID=UPI003398E60C